ncbi:scm-like with four MBT domains protein 2 [Macrobrachium nipponense]|uniref:scm-like with four MBT domains protein 2 n=1 Tax=Macrobrachium nipponense TaxID=159736 RepID=UPI0030C8642C
MEVGQILEVIHHNEEETPIGYWIAKIVTICGPLLRLRYVAQSSVSLEVWKEISSGNLQPVGWSSQHSIPLAPSQELFNSLKEESSVAEAKKAVEEALLTCHSVPEEALEGDGYTAIDRIKQGMKVEVLHEGDPFSGWVATVLQNVGGRLQLRYDTPDCSGEILWLFYQHHRLRPLDWIYHQGTPWRQTPPPLNLCLRLSEVLSSSGGSVEDAGQGHRGGTTLFFTGVLQLDFPGSKGYRQLEASVRSFHAEPLHQEDKVQDGDTPNGLLLFLDPSIDGWDAHLEDLLPSGVLSVEDKLVHIVLELKTAFLGLQEF